MLVMAWDDDHSGTLHSLFHRGVDGTTPSMRLQGLGWKANVSSLREEEVLNIDAHLEYCWVPWRIPLRHVLVMQ